MLTCLVELEWHGSDENHIPWNTLPRMLLATDLTAFWPDRIPFPHPVSGYTRNVKPWVVGRTDARKAKSLIALARCAKAPFRYDWGTSIIIYRDRC
jgi:hypothetical protein